MSGESEEELLARDWEKMTGEDQVPKSSSVAELLEETPPVAESAPPPVIEEAPAQGDIVEHEVGNLELENLAALGGGEDSPLLNQEEIDSLLGFDAGDKQKATGMRLLIESTKITHERLPALEVIYERFVRMVSGSLRHFSSENVDVNFDSLKVQRFGDYLNSVPLPAMVAIFKAEEWEGFGLITVDSRLVYSIMDVLFGGRRSHQIRVEGRTYSQIEMTMIERMTNVMLEDLSAAFEPISPVIFHFERIETNPRFASVALPTNVAMIAKFHVDIEDRGGDFELVMPHSTLEPIRSQLSQIFLGENLGDDRTWTRHFADKIKESYITICAVIGELDMTIGDVMKWEVGTIIDLDVSPGAPITIRSGVSDLLYGAMGCHRGHIAVKLQKWIVKDLDEHSVS